MNNDFLQTVDKAMYEYLLKTNRDLINVIRQLVAAGQTPSQIEARMGEGVPGLTKAAVRSAAEYIKANRQAG